LAAAGRVTTRRDPPARASHDARRGVAALAASAAGVGLAAFAAACRTLGSPVPGGPALTLFAGVALAAGGAMVLLGERRRGAVVPEPTAWLLGGALAALTTIALSSLYEISGYLRVPVDLLAWSESPFITDVLKLRLGAPLFTPPGDNNSYPYTPGTQIVTYALASALGGGDSIPFMRVVLFSYSVAAALIGVAVCDRLARHFLAGEYRHRALWLGIWAALLFLFATEPQFNTYSIALHNDGLALLVSLLAYWLIVRHATTAARWTIPLMAVLPALGFLVKQNMLLWAGVFTVYLWLDGRTRVRSVAAFAATSAVCAAVVMGGSSLLLGEAYRYWIFRALGEKNVSLARSVLHSLQAGAYWIMGLAGGALLALRSGTRRGLAPWISWALVLGVEGYTSGLGFTSNHLGPGIVIGGCWLLAALPRLVGYADALRPAWRRLAAEAMAAAALVALPGALGLVRQPRSMVPSDLDRYIAEIEREFAGSDPASILLDTGTWIYFREGVLVKDRSAPVSVHVASNATEIERENLIDTIGRIERRTYGKILARRLDSPETWYDFLDRGSGVKRAILDNYQEVRRIPAVQGVDRWFPPHLLDEIIVYVPRAD
jgi:hypothetical protein